MKAGYSRLAALSCLLAGVITVGIGCEPQGPAEKLGEKIDASVQKAKDAINPPGPAEKAGREVDKALKP